MCSQYYNNTNPPSVIARATKPQPYWLISAAEAFPANGAGVWVLPKRKDNHNTIVPALLGIEPNIN